MANIILAESGGTKTDWCIIRDGSVSDRFETIGLHPFYVGEKEWQNIAEILKQKVDPGEYILHFYGAGCFNEEGRSMTEKFVKELGFLEFYVLSDLHAAGKALLNEGTGWIAIMGTGSVLFRYTNGHVSELIGGKGHKVGDEGSGYYFGKMLWESLQRGMLSEQQLSVIDKQIDEQEIMGAVGSEQEKQILSSLSECLSESKHLFKEFHQKNIEMFYKSHICDRKSEITTLCIAGSYGFFNQELIRYVLGAEEVSVDKVIRKPIDVLIEQTVAEND